MKKRDPRPLMVSFGCGLARIVFVATLCSSGNSGTDQWVILLPPQSGVITASTTRRDLVNRFGVRNVSDGDVGIGEGETAPGTVVFPKDPIRAIEILWKDPKTKRSPESLTIGGKASRWKTAHGISLGTSLKQLEQINGKSFVLSGFGWDYSGTVHSWDNGVLSKDFEGHGRVILRLDTDLKPPNLPQPDYDHVTGDGSFSSSDPAMQKINPRVYEILWEFP